MDENIISICDEYGSKFIKLCSKIVRICLECAYILYSYLNYVHTFKKSRFIYHYWNVSRSKYIKHLRFIN